MWGFLFLFFHALQKEIGSLEFLIFPQSFLAVKYKKQGPGANAGSESL